KTTVLSSDLFDYLLPAPDGRHLALIQTNQQKIRIEMASIKIDVSAGISVKSTKEWIFEVKEQRYSAFPLCWALDGSGIFLCVNVLPDTSEGSRRDILQFVSSDAVGAAVPLGNCQISKPVVFAPSTTDRKGVWLLSLYFDDVLSLNEFVPTGVKNKVSWNRDIKPILRNNIVSKKLINPRIVGTSSDGKMVLVQDSSDVSTEDGYAKLDASIWAVNIPAKSSVKVPFTGFVGPFYEWHPSGFSYFASDKDDPDKSYFGIFNWNIPAIAKN
ncbi:MAG TPA: hypothetical protein VF719_13745, partial [Abditibacteriaceae bacterium]